MMQIRIIVLVMWLVTALGGCATPSDPKAMSVERVAVESKSSHSVSISVSGGRQTRAGYVSQISDGDYRAALKESILRSGLFRDVVEPKASRYHLDAFIGLLEQPILGASFTVKLEVSYGLIDVSAGTSIWKLNIKSSYTATMSDSPIAADRLRLANEGAARKNIEMAIEEMGKLGLP